MMSKYCCYGFKLSKKNNRGKVAYTFDENLQPTKDVTKAKVFDVNIDADGPWRKIKGYDILSCDVESLPYILNCYSPPKSRKGISKAMRLQVYNKFNGHCAYCGCEITQKEMQVDHLIPHSKNGADTLENYMPSCVVCNRVKSTCTIENFKREIRHCGRVHRKRKKPVMYDSDKIAIKYDIVTEDKKITLYFEKKEEIKL